MFPERPRDSKPSKFFKREAPKIIIFPALTSFKRFVKLQSGIKPTEFWLKLENTSFFSNAIASLLPNIPMWAEPIFVIIATSGFNTFTSSFISPFLFIPISKTPTSWEELSMKIERGRPVSEFKFPWLTNVLYFWENKEPIISLTVVFPEDPVIAILIFKFILFK